MRRSPYLEGFNRNSETTFAAISLWATDAPAMAKISPLQYSCLTSDISSTMK
jgi:hypothetical protein